MERVNHLLPVGQIKPNAHNVRNHPRAQIRKLAANIKSIGFTAPLLVDENKVLIAGHARWEAVQLLGWEAVPAVELRGLSEAQKRAVTLADNKLFEGGGWNREQLAIELTELPELLTEEGLDISVTGFTAAEIDELQVDFEQDSTDPSDDIKSSWATGPLVSEPGTMWIMGPHRLLCGDARSEAAVDRLMGGSVAAMGFADPPYNLRVREIGGRGRTKHPEFRMGSGEMSSSEYRDFLTACLSNARRVLGEGSLHFVCCDWRHIGELLAAGGSVYDAVVNVVVWVKSNAGQGSFYRSAHELIAVFRTGSEGHLNNVQLGRHGRSRSNVWRYAGVNTFRAGRMDELRAHPTAKPVALVADAIRDCTRRRDIVLDLFAGSGATIMAAERVGRAAYAMEIEPRYVDVAVRRWQAFTRRDALDDKTGCTFDELAEKRVGAVEPVDQLSASAPSLARSDRKQRASQRSNR